MTAHSSLDRDPCSVPDIAVRAEQIEVLYGSPAVQFMNLVNAPIVAAALWGLYPAWVLITWIGLFVVVLAARTLLWRQYRGRQSAPGDALIWGRRFAIGSAVTGALWGLAASAVFFTSDPAYYVFVAFVVGGMTAGAAMRDSAYLPAFYGYALPSVVPMILGLLTESVFLSRAMGLLLTSFAAVLVVMAHNYHRWMTDNIRLRMEQVALNRDLQRMTADLKHEAADREQVSAALKESNDRLRGIGESAQDAIIISDSDGNVAYWNPAAERIFGYTAGEIMGRSIHRLLAAERYRAHAVESYKHFAETGQGDVLGKTLQLAAVRKDGTEFPIDLSVSAMPHGKAWHALGIARDISNRAKVAAALEEREAELKEAQRLAHVGNWIWHPDTDKVEWSEEMYRIFSQDPAVPVPRVKQHAHLMKEHSFQRLQAALQACRDTGSLYEIDLEIVRPDGTTGWVSARGEAKRDADGRIVSVRGTAHDITARVRADEKTREQEAMFRGLVEQGMCGIFIIAEDGTLAYLNPRFAEMLGFKDAAGAIGHRIIDSVAEADKTTARNSMQAVFSGSKASDELAVTIVQKQGGTIDLLAQGAASTFQGKRVIIAVALDVSERKRSEAQIAKLNEQMTATVAMLRRHERDQSAIAKLSDLLQSCHSRAEAYPIIAATASRLFPNVDGALSHIKPGTKEVNTVAQWGAGHTTLPRFSFDDCWALRSGQRYEVDAPDTATVCRHFKSAPHGPYLCLPLTVQGETTGLLHLGAAPGVAINDELRQLMQSFGDVVKLSLTNLKLRDTLSEQALRDQLTTLFNRHYLAETMPREIRRAQRNRKPLSVAMLDIDHFKGFNDAHGHDAGDAVLKEIGMFLHDALRAGDIACRYGGEEFLLVLPECDLTGAKSRLVQLAQQIKRKAFNYRGKKLPNVTLSVGVAQLSDDLVSAGALITAADEALYAAKRNGRDRIELYAHGHTVMAALPRG